jgi:GTP-binding protein LepA
MSPSEYAGNIMELIKRKRGTDMDTKPIDESTWLFTAKIPWGEVVTDFHDELKNTTAGYASFDSRLSESMEFKEASLCKVEIMLNGEVVEPLSFVSHRDLAQGQGRKVCKKLQEVLPRQQFVTVIQAKADSKIIASERIRAFRKDVLTTGGSKAVGGGDVTRKKKLLEKQKAGKKRQQTSGRVTLSQEAFNSVISRAK